MKSSDMPHHLVSCNNSDNKPIMMIVEFSSSLQFSQTRSPHCFVDVIAIAVISTHTCLYYIVIAVILVTCITHPGRVSEVGGREMPKLLKI